MPKRPLLWRILLGGWLVWSAAYAQQPALRTYAIRRAAGPIRIDGLLNDPGWRGVGVANAFFQHFPDDSIPARWQSEVRMTFDDRFLYVGVFCRDSSAGGYVIESLKRDFSFPKNDAFAVTLDPTEDKTTGFNFTTSPYGVQREGLISGGGTFGVSTAWDAPWYVETHITDSGWYAEMAVPFKVLRYFPDRPTWGINFARNHLKAYERSVWNPVPRNYNVSTLLFTGRLRWLDPPPTPGLNFAFSPYVAGGYEYSGTDRPFFRTGFDGKLAVTPSLTADFTVYPDFSHADVDRQVIDLDRFSIFFPEKRYFFLENNDLFSWVGFMRIRPFFSRRIGLYKGRVIPIIYGLRLSGKATPRLRIGILNAQTEGRADLALPPNNHTVVAAQYRVGAASNLSFIGVNRQAFAGFQPVDSDYNRVMGGDYHFATTNGRIRGKTFLHSSISPFETPRQGWAHGLWVMYKTEKLAAHWNHEWVTPSYRAELGFVPRTGYFRLEPFVSYRMYRAEGPVYYHGPQIYWSAYWTPTGRKTDDDLSVEYEVEFRNTSELVVEGGRQYVELTFPFDPTEAGNPPLPEGSDYVFHYVQVGYSSDVRKPWKGGASVRYGGYYSGTMARLRSSFAYQWRPYLTAEAAYSMAHIRMPYLTAPVTHHLVRLSGQLTLTRNLYWTLTGQYNTQLANFSLYSRLQYRYHPLSDIFLIVNHNFPLAADASGLPSWVTFKVNYWLQP